MAHPAAGTWYARLAVNTAEPRDQRPVDPPVPALADVELYDGTRALLKVNVVAAARGLVCIAQPAEGRDTWHAWVRASDVRRR